MLISGLKNKPGEDLLISARKAALQLDITVVSFLAAVNGGHIKCQSDPIRINNKTVRAFDPEYIDQIKRILPKERAQGVPLFRDNVIEKLKILNAAWEKQKS